MAKKTWYFKDQVATGSNFGSLTETSDTVATSGTGWEVSSLNVHAPGDMAELDFGVEVASGSSAWSTSSFPNSVLDNTLGDALRSENALTGTFLPGEWVFSSSVQAVSSGGSQDGRLRLRLLKSPSITGGSNVTEITTTNIASTKVTDLATSSPQTIIASFSTSQPIVFDSEYLFASYAWEITGKNVYTDSWTAYGNCSWGSGVNGPTGVANEGSELVISGADSLTYIYKDFVTTGDTHYKFTVWVKSNSGSLDFKISHSDGAWNGTYTSVGSTETATTTWQRFEYTFVTGPSETTAYMIIGSENKTPFTCDDGTYVISNYEIESTGISPRSWTTSNCTVQTGVFAGPVNNDALKVAYDADANNTFIYKIYSSQTAETEYVVDVWIKTDTGTKDFKISRTDTVSWDATYSITSDVLTATTTWQKFSLTYNTGPGETSSSIVIGSEQRGDDFNCTVGNYFFWNLRHYKTSDGPSNSKRDVALRTYDTKIESSVFETGTVLFFRNTSFVSGSGETMPSGEQSGATPNMLSYSEIKYKLSSSIGGSQTGASILTNANTDYQQGPFGLWISDKLSSATINKALKLSLGMSEGSTNSNFAISYNAYVWRPSTGAKVATFRDLTTTGGIDSGTGERAEILDPGDAGTISVSDGDRLVIEIWRSSYFQDAATTYTNTFYFDGTSVTDVNQAAVSNYASYAVISGTMLSFSTQQTVTGSTILSGSGGLQASADLLIFAQSSISGSGNVVADSTLLIPGASTLSGSGGFIAASSTNVVVGQTVLSSSGDITADSSLVVFGSGTISGSGNVVADSTLFVLGSSALSGSGGLFASSINVVLGQIVLSGSSNLTGDSSVSVNAAAALSGAGDISALGTNATFGQALISGSGTFSALASLLVLGAGSLSGSGDIEAVSSNIVNAIATLAGSGSLSAQSSGVILGSITFQSTGSMVGIGSTTTIYFPPKTSIPLQNIVKYCSGKFFVSSSTQASVKLYGYGLDSAPIVVASIFNESDSARHVNISIKSVSTTEVSFEFSSEFTGYVHWRAVTEI